MKRTKNILSILLIVALMLSLIGCGKAETPKNAVNNMFAALKEVNIEEAEKYIDGGKFAPFEEDDAEDGEDELDSMPEPLLTALFDATLKKLSYNIISSEVKDDNTAVVKAEITVTDMTPIASDFISQMFSYLLATAFITPQPTDEEKQQAVADIFIRLCNNTELSTVTKQADINLVKTESGEWKVKVDASLGNIILGGIQSAFNDVDSPFGSDETNE